MASRRDIKKLQNEFPDMTQSVLGDVLTTYQNNKELAADALRGIKQEQQRELDVKVQELKEMFPSLPDSTIIQELQQCHGNVDSAIAPLFGRMQEIQQQEKKKHDQQTRQKRLEQESAKQKEEEKKQVNNLMDIFKTISKEKVQELLDENEGDIEETTAQLLAMVAKQEESKKEKVAQQKAEEEKRKRLEQEQRMKDLKFQALRDKFEDLPDNQITSALNATGWDIKKALADLYVVSFQKKKKEIKDLFQSVNEEEIGLYLEENNQDKVKTVKFLTLERERKRIEAEDRAMREIEREQRRKQKRDERKHKQQQKKKEEAAKRALYKVVQTTTTPAPVPAPVEPEPEPEEVEQEQDDEKPEEEAPVTVSPTPAVVISKVKQNALERSMIIGQMIEQEIAASNRDFAQEEERQKKAQIESVRNVFRNKLEDIIEKQARDNSVPGMVPPPLPKQIDNMLGKNRPVVDAVEAKLPTTEGRELPQVEGRGDKGDYIKPLIALTVKQPIVDIGNPVVVDWEITSGVSSAWDWIGLFPVDQPNKQYVTYQWSGKQLMKGSLTFSAPNVYGEYEFRYFPNGYYEHAAMSKRFKVGPQIELVGAINKATNKMSVKWTQLTGNLYSRSWIGLYEKSEADNKNYVHFEYAGKPNTEILFDAPFKPREYEFRFFTNSYVDVARSNSIRVEGEDTMTASFEDGFVKVKLNIVTIDPSTESGWLGVYFTHETNNRQWRRYKYFSSRIGDCQFKAPRTQGEYEVRMFANNTYDMILKSNTFKITESK